MKCVCERCHMDLLVYYTRKSEWDYVAEIEKFIMAGAKTVIYVCPTCEDNQQFKLSKDDEKMNEKQPENKTENAPGMASFLTPEMIGPIVQSMMETAQSVQDIPAQLQFASMVNLAKSFIIWHQQRGEFLFDEGAFRRTWDALLKVGDAEEKAP